MEIIDNYTDVYSASERLNLSRNQISDITPLAELTNLEILELNNNRISDVTPLIELKKLNWLYLSDNQISDPSPLAELTGLRALALSNNQISDISFLEHYRHITGLSLNNNQISDITPLTYLRLLFLDLGSNQVTDISPLRWMGELIELNLHHNQIADISPLFLIMGWTSNLRVVSLHNNPLPLSQVNEFREIIADSVVVFHSGRGCADCEMQMCQCPHLTLVIENGVIHLRNTTDAAISARGFYLTNDDGTPNQRLPAVIIRAGETVQIRQSSDDVTSVLKRMESNFDLSVADSLRFADINR
jgi:hypothetical protein